MITAGLTIKILFLVAVSFIWVMILYQIVMTLAGYRHRIKSARKTEELMSRGGPLPGVSILIPARNEEVVIEDTLGALRNLRYPDSHFEVIVIDDGSTDGTAEIVRRAAAEDSRIRLLQLPVKEQGRGKSHALNTALKAARHGLIAVYDADNRPEPESLEILVRRLMSDNKTGAVLGKFRTINRNRNLLTRFINLETLGFQWIVQAGRCALFGVGILPGTNFVIRRQVLEACGGWDEKAITEDTELSVRVYEKGWKIDFAPEAVSWEEEPEKWRIWIRQRTRWVRGNFYVLRKFMLSAWKFKNKFLALQLLYLSVLYYLFLFSVLVSHAIFFLCISGVLRVNVPGPYTAVWISAVLLFIAELYLVASYEEEHAVQELGLAALMYITYCQAWIVVVFRAMWHEFALKEGAHWDKTVRFGTAKAPPAKAAVASDGEDEASAGKKKSSGEMRGFFLIFFLLFSVGISSADTLWDAVRGKKSVLDAHWGEFYVEGVYQPEQDENLIGFGDIKDGFRVCRIEGAELLLYGKVRAFKDVNDDFWNNKALYGPGIRLKPFKDYGLYLFAEYLFGNYYGLENKDKNPYSSSFDALETGAAFWQRWGALKEETSFFLPFTGWRELYWDCIYFEQDDYNVIGYFHFREGFGSIDWGPLTNDFYVRVDGTMDRNKDYWNNRVQTGVGVRFRPAIEGHDIQVCCELVGGHYLDRGGRYELPYDRDYISFRLEMTYWFGW